MSKLITEIDFKLSRVKLQRKVSEGKKNHLELAGFGVISRLRVIEVKCTVNI